MHIFSSYAKILGEKLFRTWELPRSGSKAKNGEEREREREREKERLNNDKNNGQLRIATPPRVAHAKPPGPKNINICQFWPISLKRRAHENI